MKNLFKKIAILSIAMMVFGCSKDGATGATGATGNANVVGTNSITTTSSSWTSSSGGSLWQASFSAAGITQSVVDRGVISVFKSDSAGSWTALPYTFGYESWTYYFGVGFVGINRTNTTLSSIANPASQTFRVVIVSPSSRMAHPNTNWNNYDEVKGVLKLID